MRYQERDGVLASYGRGAALAALLVLCLAHIAYAGAKQPMQYNKAVALGVAASAQAAGTLGAPWQERTAIVMTNAGFALPQGLDTQGCLDGVTRATGASIGAARLITVQSRFDAPLWFAFYDVGSGRCAYLEYTAQDVQQAFGKNKARPVATTVQVRRIEAKYLFAHPEELSAPEGSPLFGGNAFRIITAINAADHGAGSSLLRAVQVHDHLCPGVSSGIAIASYIREHLVPGPDTKVFVLSLKPWCKEDALTTLLNATPGKRAYAVLYPTDEEVAAWPKPLPSVCSVVFTKTGDAPWHATMLGFDFAEAKKAYGGDPYGVTILDKLHADLWFMDNMDAARGLVTRVKDADLAPGQTPRALMRPGVDVISALSAL